MIVDTLAHFETGCYADVFAKIIPFIRTLTPETALGRHEISGDDIFAVVSVYDTKSLVDAKLETHREYADVQILLRGMELIFWAPAEGLSESVSYNSERDIAFWELCPRMSAVTLYPGVLCLLFPSDAHMPQIALDDQFESVMKVVIKIRMNQFDC